LNVQLTVCGAKEDVNARNLKIKYAVFVREMLI